MSSSAADADRLRQRGFRLEYATMTWMVAEAALAITAAAALLGVGLNTWLGWWRADPAALIIAALAVREGIECWEIDNEAER